MMIRETDDDEQSVRYGRDNDGGMRNGTALHLIMDD